MGLSFRFHTKVNNAGGNTLTTEPTGEFVSENNATMTASEASKTYADRDTAAFPTKQQAGIVQGGIENGMRARVRQYE